MFVCLCVALGYNVRVHVALGFACVCMFVCGIRLQCTCACGIRLSYFVCAPSQVRALVHLLHMLGKKTKTVYHIYYITAYARKTTKNVYHIHCITAYAWGKTFTKFTTLC